MTLDPKYITHFRSIISKGDEIIAKKAALFEKGRAALTSFVEVMEKEAEIRESETALNLVSTSVVKLLDLNEELEGARKLQETFKAILEVISPSEESLVPWQEVNFPFELCGRRLLQEIHLLLARYRKHYLTLSHKLNLATSPTTQALYKREVLVCLDCIDTLESVLILIYPKDGAQIMAKLTAKSRKALPKSDFVDKKDRKYPIEDESHARNALSRASGKAIDSKVKREVKEKFPSIAVGGKVKPAKKR